LRSVRTAIRRLRKRKPRLECRAPGRPRVSGRDNQKRTIRMAKELTVGDKAPALSLPDQSGERVNLKDFTGKQVVLYFYPKDDTPGCTKESCDFRDAGAPI